MPASNAKVAELLRRYTRDVCSSAFEGNGDGVLDDSV